MTETQRNWDIHWKWDWFKNWGWEQPRFRYGYAGKSCRYYDVVLKRFDCHTVLDCTCGCGPKAIVLTEMNYRVTGTDISGFAVDKARELSKRLGHHIPYYRSSWRDLSSHLDEKFDCVLNDALPWTERESDLLLSVAEFGKLLEPGGIVLWAGPDEWNGRGLRNRERVYEELASSIEPYSVDGPFEHDGVRMIQVVIRRLERDFVDVVNLYLIEESGRLRLEHDSLPQLFRWTWEDFAAAFKQAGFSDLRSHRVTLDGEERILNVAVK